ncbi:MAG: hydantoinase/oxoprolinase family protein [Vicinamibacterales bacterium]|nr:hydantoinase/oxoprolinase family protein [Vicinamibacterales bacterium]
MRIGVDTGGTFTDLVLLDDSGLRVHKVRSTPDDPSRAILTGIRELAGAAPVGDIVHGSTVATNAVLERRGARVALIATAGFEDVLRIGRQTRRELYNFLVADRRPLVDDGLTFGLRERLAYDGRVLDPLEDADIDALVVQVQRSGAVAAAVCLLHSYINPAHEQRVAAKLEAAGFLVSASHAVLPEYREFERWSTTVVNAYVTPLMARYLTALEENLEGSRLSIMQSNGGSISAARAKAAAVQTILSGPAAGAVGALAVGQAAGFSRLIGFDMGGTSTDVTLINGQLGMTTESTVGDFPVRLPIIDIHTVGAGGGSVAYLDAGGALRVGPRSAGADPGPVCYGKGDELTVTDANLLLGRLDPEFFLGGRMALDTARTQAIAEPFAARLGLTVHALAEGIVRVANANMERAIRVVSVQRGFDPRDFALLAFGGAGGMHACEIAETLNIGTVITPRHAGVLSALGMLLADVTKDYSQTILRPAESAPFGEIDSRFEPLVAHAAEDLRAEGFAGPRAVIERSLDVRYVGQSYEITVPFTAEFAAEFDTRHAQLYGYANPARPKEIVNLRVRATGVTDKPELPQAPVTGAHPPEAARVSHAYFGGQVMPTGVYRQDDLVPGSTAAGPAVIIGPAATTVVPPGFRFEVDGFGNIIATRTGAAAPRRTRQAAEAAV